MLKMNSHQHDLKYEHHNYCAITNWKGFLKHF